MPGKKILSKTQMSELIGSGIMEIAGIVKRTLGPGGLPILIERQGQALDGDPLGPMITKDGVTVANYCSNPDPGIDLVMQSVKAICAKTNRIAGDGTTTAIVLGEAILLEALSVLSQQATLNPQLVRESIEAASTRAIELLSKEVATIEKPEQIEHVATISANGDTSIGQIIRQAFEEVGSEGVITVDEGHSAQTTIDVVKGFQIKRGAEAQDRFFNNKEDTRFETKDPLVLLYDGQLQNYTDLIPAFQKIAQEYKTQGTFPPIVIVANDFSQEVIQFLLIQKVEAHLTICAVRSPHMSYVRTGMLDDMAVLLGGTRLGNGNRNIQSAEFADIGSCDRVVIDKYTATFYGGDGKQEDILARIDQLKAMKSSAESPYDSAIFQDRISALGQGVAKIGVGGSTEMEIKERYHRIEDALNAARAAVEEGVVVGGGIALFKVALQFDEQGSTVGEQILAKALKTPLMQIIENVGQSPKKIINQNFLTNILDETGKVYDARNKTIVRAFDAGILDPFKVVRVALENAVSIAALLSTCGGGIINLRE